MYNVYFHTVVSQFAPIIGSLVDSRIKYNHGYVVVSVPCWRPPGSQKAGIKFRPTADEIIFLLDEGRVLRGACIYFFHSFLFMDLPCYDWAMRQLDVTMPHSAHGNGPGYLGVAQARTQIMILQLHRANNGTCWFSMDPSFWRRGGARHSPIKYALLYTPSMKKHR